MGVRKALFETIAADLEQKIERGEYKAGMLMPSEKELQRLFSVSRTTIRKAVDLLVAKQLVIRKNGVGLYVQPKITAQNILEMTGVMKSQSAAQTKKIIQDFYVRKAGSYYAKVFDIKENELIYFIKFLQKADHRSTTEQVILPFSFYPNLQAKDLQIITVLELINTGKYSLFALEQELQLVTASSEQVKHLEVKENTPLFKLSTHYYTETKRCIAVGYRYENAIFTEYVVDFN